jgi:nuclear cap-binding protein subunit 2
MASLLLKRENDAIPEYYTKRKNFDLEKLNTSKTLYIGNLSFYTNQIQLYEFFSQCGKIDKIIMGVNRKDFTPCGFCFVIYQERSSAELAVKSLDGTKLDNRIIRVDWDMGYEEGREYGRGKNGGQKRDEVSMKRDPERQRNRNKNDSYIRKRERDDKY